MFREVRWAVLAAAIIACVFAATTAHAQRGSVTDEPFSGPALDDEFPGGKGAQKTPTPTPTRTETPEPTPEETRTPEPTASAEPSATAKPGGRNGKNLPNTGSDALRIGLMGFTLLGFGLSLRLSLTEARRRDL